MPLIIRTFPIDDDIADQPLSRTYKFILQMHRLNRCSHCGVTKGPEDHEWCAACRIQIKEGRLHRRVSKKAGTPGWLKALRPFKLKILRSKPPTVSDQIDGLLEKTDLSYSAISRQLRCSRQLVNQRARFRGLNAVERATTMRSDLLAYLEYDAPVQTEMRLVWDVAKKFGADVRRIRPTVCDHAVVPLLKNLIINGRSVRVARCSKLDRLGGARFHCPAATNQADFTILVLCTRLSGPVFYVVPDAVFQQYRGPTVIRIPILTKRMQGVGGWWNEYLNRWDLIIPTCASADGSVQLPPLVLARPLPRRLRDPRLFPATRKLDAAPPHSPEAHQP